MIFLQVIMFSFLTQTYILPLRTISTRKLKSGNKFSCPITMKNRPKKLKSNHNLIQSSTLAGRANLPTDQNLPISSPAPALNKKHGCQHYLHTIRGSELNWKFYSFNPNILYI